MVVDALAGFFDDHTGPVLQVAKFVVAFALIYLAGRFVLESVARRAMKTRNLDEHARRPLMKAVKFTYVFAAVAVAFGAAGFGSLLTSLATVAAAATLAIGFATQNLIRNFVSGVFIFVDRPFKIGDWIEWQDYDGVVEDISLRVTRVRTFDNELLTVPNSELTENVVKNSVDADRLRLKFVFGIGYDDDVERATEIIEEEAGSHPDIMDEPAPSVRLNELADSYVGLQARIWIENPQKSDFVRIRSEYVEAVKKRFDEEDIEIPFPQRTISGSLDTRDGEEI
ncbi:MAG: mechanosensitive ion channel family protein [Halobacteriales archaeon]